MPEPDDHQLLGDFARAGSETAFATLVTRYVNLVYSTALRFTGNPHHAEEITQAVFVILARKAAGLSPRVVLSGWLYQATRLTAANFIKGEIRRQQREQEVYMQSLSPESTDAAWNEMAPLLDEAMGQLGKTDRDAIVLRFFENKSAAEIGTALRMNEDTARRRVNRALDKLRKYLSRRGVASTTAIIAGAISANSVHAAPPGLGEATVATAAKGLTISATLTTLVKGTMKTMTWMKLKFAIGVAVTMILAAGVATVAVSQISNGSDSQMTPEEILERTQAVYAGLTSYTDSGTATGTIGTQTVPPHTFTTKLARPNLYQIIWQQDMGGMVMTGMTWSVGSGNFVKITSHSRPTLYPTMKNDFAAATGISGDASGLVPLAFFSLNAKNRLGPLALPAVRRPDEKIGDVDCYVLSETNGGRAETVWIGKSDFLVRQAESDVSAATLQKTLQAAAKQNPQVKGMTANIAGDVELIETHSNIVLNVSLTSAGFAP